MTSPNPTLVRQSKASDLPVLVGPNLLINPVFEHIITKRGASGTMALPTAFSDTFQYAPGWYDWGGENCGSLGQPNPASQQYNPFRAGANCDSGIEIEQTAQWQKGVVQLVPRGATLRGRRIRVSGCYRIPTGGNPDDLTGISIWLKGAVVDEAGAGAWVSNTDYSMQEDCMHVIRVTTELDAADAANTYDSGEELFFRAFDSWTFDGVDDSITFGGAGVRSQQAIRVFLLNGTFTDDAALGDVEVYTETQVGDGATHYFEAFFDVPNEAGLFPEDDVWIIAMPVSPDSQGDMTGDATIVVWGLSLEVVVQEAEGQVLTGLLSPAPFGSAMGYGSGGLPLEQLYRYPIYVPTIYPLDVHGAPKIASDYSNVYKHIDVGDRENLLSFYGSGSVALVAKQHTPPPGAHIISAAWRYALDTNSGSATASELYQVLTFDPADTATKASQQVVCDWGALGTTGWKECDAVRNRVGMYWPADAADALEDFGAQAAASLWFEQTLTGNGSGHTAVQDGFIYAVEDPRLGRACWKNPSGS